jgi:primase-polymerase (primpol)-like protein
LRLIATQPLYEKTWSVVSNCILLATFGTTIWLGISQTRADQASVATAQTAVEANTIAVEANTIAVDANTIAEQSLQVANESETTAVEALNQALANNNISATNNNNAGYQEWLAIEQYCEINPLVRKIKPPVRNKL